MLSEKLGQQHFCQIFKTNKMKKKFILLGIILMNGMFFSCSNDDDQDLSAYQKGTEMFATGGDDGQIQPPPPPIP